MSKGLPLDPIALAAAATIRRTGGVGSGGVGVVGGWGEGKVGETVPERRVIADKAKKKKRA